MVPAMQVTPSPRLIIRGLHSPLAGPFDVSLKPSECLVVSGASGSGKSLFLRMVADLDPNEGEVLLDGRARRETSPADWRRQVVYIAAESGWWTDRVDDHFAERDKPAARLLAESLGVSTVLFDGSVERLSTGERQRLALIRGLVLDAPVMLLDEPTGRLDPQSVSRVEALLRQRLQAGTTLILVSHDPGQADRLNARRIVMSDGRLGPPS